MAKIVKLPPRGSSEGAVPSAAARRAPRAESRPSGLSGLQATPPILAAALLAVLLVVGGIWFAMGRASAAANSAPMDTSMGSDTGSAGTSANGMDTSTGSAAPAVANGMNTGTGH
jgi:hypothetical protein